MDHEIRIKTDNLEEWNIVKSYLDKIGIKAELKSEGVYYLRWDDKAVEKKLGRQAGNAWVKEDLRIADVLVLMDRYWKRGSHGTFAQEYLGISKSTFLRRMRYFAERYGGLERALEAGCIYFTNRPTEEKA